MSCESPYYKPIEIEELSKLIDSLPELHKCRVIGFLDVEFQSYVVKSFSGLVSYKVNVIFNELTNIRSVTVPEPVQIFGEVVHFLNETKKKTSALKIIILHNIKPCLITPLYEIVKEIKEMKSNENVYLEGDLT